MPNHEKGCIGVPPMSCKAGETWGTQFKFDQRGRAGWRLLVAQALDGVELGGAGCGERAKDYSY